MSGRRDRRLGGELVHYGLREAEKDPALGPMLKLFRKDLTELSDGRIYL